LGAAKGALNSKETGLKDAHNRGPEENDSEH
jgi:hypothetical protein